MFVQVIQGRVEEPAKLRTALDRWKEQLRPGASGWLGSTSGVTDDGRFIALVRFDSEESAQHNSERPEQDAWWSETSQHLSDVTFRNSTHVNEDVIGDPGSAGFVQVMEGHGSNPERAREIMSQDSEAWAAFRPDVLGNLVVEHDDGAFTMVIYFPSEETAREGEAKEMPPELQGNMDELNSLMTGEPTFYDLKDPWLDSPS